MTGYVTGSVSGVAMLLLRFAEASTHSATWLRTYDGVSIMTNTLVTGLGMWFGSRVLVTRTKEQQQVQGFFRDMRQPLQPQKAGRGPHAEIAKVTAAVGALLGLAGIVSTTVEARAADSAVAAVLVLLGGVMWMRRDRTPEEHAEHAATPAARSHE